MLTSCKSIWYFEDLPFPLAFTPKIMYVTLLINHYFYIIICNIFYFNIMKREHQL